jgi:hypothetical protein
MECDVEWDTRQDIEQNGLKHNLQVGIWEVEGREVVLQREHLFI